MTCIFLIMMLLWVLYDKQSSTFHDFQLPHQPIYEGDDEIETADGTRNTATTTSEWSNIDMNKDWGHSINPVKWTGDTVESTVNITDEEAKKLKDASGEIRYEKVFQWCLPLFDDDDDYQTYLVEFQAANMRNYMRKHMVENAWSPKFYTVGQTNYRWSCCNVLWWLSF